MIIRCAEAGISNLVCCAVLASLIDLVGLSWCVTFLFCSNCKCAFCVDGMFVCTYVESGRKKVSQYCPLSDLGQFS